MGPGLGLLASPLAEGGVLPLHRHPDQTSQGCQRSSSVVLHQPCRLLGCSSLSSKPVRHGAGRITGRSGSGLRVSTPPLGETAESSGTRVGSLQAVKNQSPAELLQHIRVGGGAVQPQRGTCPLTTTPPSCAWVVQSRGPWLLSRTCVFSQGCENQDTFPWGLLCPIKLEQINLADGITAPTSHNLFTSSCWLAGIL